MLVVVDHLPEIFLYASSSSKVEHISDALNCLIPAVFDLVLEKISDSAELMFSRQFQVRPESTSAEQN